MNNYRSGREEFNIVYCLCPYHHGRLRSGALLLCPDLSDKASYKNALQVISVF